MRRIALASIAALLTTGAALAADGFSLSGTYEGFFVCDDVTDGAGGAFGRAMTMEVVQSGDGIVLRNTVAVDPAGPESHTLFRRRVVADAGGSLSGYAEVCGGTFPHKEMVRILPASPARTPFSFAADTIFVSEAVPGVGAKLVVESCKWALTRVSAEPPQFAPCE